jgi:hypothetical protein
MVWDGLGWFAIGFATSNMVFFLNVLIQPHREKTTSLSINVRQAPVGFDCPH